MILIGNGRRIKVDVKRGDIVLVNFEPIRGSEQGGIRPSIIIQNDIFNKYSPTTIVAPITSKSFKKEYPTNVFMMKEDSKLSRDSTVLLNQIKTIDKSRIIKKITAEAIKNNPTCALFFIFFISLGKKFNTLCSSRAIPTELINL